MELTRDEKLALLIAVKKDFFDTRIDEISNEMKEEILNSEYSNRKISVHGTKVGQVIKMTPDTKPFIPIERGYEAFCALADMGLVDWTKVEKCLKKDWQKRFAHIGDVVVDTETSEVCDWLLWQDVVRETAQIRMDKPEKIREAFMPLLENGDDMYRLLMEGGSDGE